MTTVQRALTAEQVSQYLISNGLYLTGLEFLVEGQELGNFDLRFLQSFFEDKARFPPEEVQRFQGEDVLSSILMAKEREQKLCLAEYELRVATEDLKHTKMQGSGDLASVEELQSPGLLNDTPIQPDPDNDERTLRKHLNSVVMAYLMHCGYKVTAMTFQEEGFPDFEKEQLPAQTLSHYYHTSQEAVNKSANSTSDSPVSENVDPVDCGSQNEGEGCADVRRHRVLSAMGRSEMQTASDATSLRDSTANGVTTDGEVESEPRTPWPPQPSPKAPLNLLPSEELLCILVEYIPKIVPNVLIKKRSDCIPVIAALIRDHPHVECRASMLAILFGLIKHPDADQRQSIVHGIGSLAKEMGSERITQEIIPSCCELANHKRVEKRLMVTEVIGVIAAFVDDDIRSSLLLSLLQQLSSDTEVSVRRAALCSLLSCLEAAPVPPYKQRIVEDLVFKFLQDDEVVVSDLALAELVPLVRDSKKGLRLSVQIVQRIFENIHNVLDASPAAEKGTTAELAQVPKNPQQKNILSMLELYLELLSDFAELCSAEIPFWVKHNLKSRPLPDRHTNETDSEDPLTPAADMDRTTLDQSLTGQKATAFCDWLDDAGEDKSPGQIRLFVTEILPSLINAIRRIAPANECFKLREKLTCVSRATYKAFPWCIADGAIQPMFVAAAGLGHLYPLKELTGSEIMEQLMSKERQESHDAATVFPICFALILSESGRNSIRELLLRVLTHHTSEPTPWAIHNKKEFVAAVVFAGSVSANCDVLASLMSSFNDSEESFVRCGAALMAEALCVHASYQDAYSVICPMLVKLLKDSGLIVRLHAIAALQQISVIHCNAMELVDQVYAAAESLMTSDVPQAKLAALTAFSQAASQCSDHSAFVLKQIPLFIEELHQATQDTGDLHLHLTATAVFKSLVILEGLEMSDPSMRSKLVSCIENLMQTASSLLDNAQRQILSAMMADQTSKMGTFKRRIRSSLGGKKMSVSSDTSCTSDVSR